VNRFVPAKCSNLTRVNYIRDILYEVATSADKRLEHLEAAEQLMVRLKNMVAKGIKE
jgi:hypothetical protein